MKLVPPSKKFEESWLATISECRQESPDLTGPGLGVFMVDQCNPENIEDYIQLTKNYSNGEDLPEGWVPCTNFWLVDDSEFIGAISFRRELNDQLSEFGGHLGYFIRPSKRDQGHGTQMLQLALERIRNTTQLQRVMITCNENNQRSQAVIEKNGGVFERHSKIEHDGEKVRIYWVVL